MKDTHNNNTSANICIANSGLNIGTISRGNSIVLKFWLDE